MLRYRGRVISVRNDVYLHARTHARSRSLSPLADGRINKILLQTVPDIQ